MGYGYKIYFDRKSVKLEKSDQKQEKHNSEQDIKIKYLEDKNGEEQHQIDELKEHLAQEKKDKSELKDMVIKLQNRIINCEKQGNSKKKHKRH
jgi:hypothetical protein